MEEYEKYKDAFLKIKNDIDRDIKIIFVDFVCARHYMSNGIKTYIYHLDFKTLIYMTKLYLDETNKPYIFTKTKDSRDNTIYEIDYFKENNIISLFKDEFINLPPK